MISIQIAALFPRLASFEVNSNRILKSNNDAYLLQNKKINDLVKPKTGGLQALKDANPDIDFDTDWNRPQFERDREYPNQYDEPEVSPPEYPFQDFNYGP